MSSFGSADLPEPGEVLAQGFAVSNYNPFADDYQPVQYNFGGAASVGVFPRVAITGRYENAARALRVSSEKLENYERYRYVAGGFQVSLIEDVLSGGIYYGSYRLDGGVGLRAVKGEMLVSTPSPRRKFRYTFVVQGHLFTEYPQFDSFTPMDIVVGNQMAMSTDLDRWAIRAEVFSSASLIMGVGVSAEFRFGAGPTDLELANRLRAND